MEALVLEREQVRQGVPLFAELAEEVDRLYPDAPDKLRFNECLKRVLDRLVSDLIDHSRAQIAHANLDSVEAVRHQPHRLISFSPQADRQRLQLKNFLYDSVYFSPTIQSDKDQGEQVIAELFEFFMQMPGELPASYQEKMQQEPLHRIVCDYIAGMTDNYVQQQHRRFCSGGAAVAL